MQCTTLRFNYEKGTQAINYFAIKNSGKIDKIKAIKLIFLADRYHLRKFCRPITNDNYIAMEMGPVGSGVKDVIDQTIYLSKKARLYATEFLEKEDNSVKSKKEIDGSVFSRSDIEALNYIWKEFGKYNGFRLKEITHKCPEWKKHESAIKAGAQSIEMSYLDFFDDSKSHYNYGAELTPEEKSYGRDLLVELSQVENAWE